LVLDNLFSTAISVNEPWLAHGFIANNTGDNPNRVRRNRFIGMHRALKLQGDNRTSTYDDGLKYSCNTFENNLSDIREVNSNIGNPTSYGVPHQFSLFELLPADPSNSFTQSGCTTCGNDDISNTTTSSLANHNYVRVMGSQEPDDFETSDPPKINFIFSIGGLDDCLEVSQLILGGGQSEEESLLLSKQTSELNYSTVKDLYQELVDGGDTDALIEIIEGTTYSLAIQTYYDLMSKSPYVSEEALIEALKQYELPNVLLTDILSSNPHAAKSGRVSNEMEQRPVSFDEYQKAQINQGLAFVSNKEYLELQMAGWLSHRKEAIAALFYEIDCNEQVLNKNAAKFEFLDETNYFSDLLTKSMLLADQGDYVEARTLLSTSPDYFRLTTEDLSDLSALDNLFELHEALKTTGLIQLSYDQQNNLYNMLNENSALVACEALDLLINYTGFEYIPPIIELEPEEKSQILQPAGTMENVTIYPNPASNWIIVESLQTDLGNIVVLDALGREVDMINADPAAKQQMLSVTHLPAGCYTVCIYGIIGEIISVSSLIKL
jgi:Secretion system C-terminal sorting domain